MSVLLSLALLQDVEALERHVRFLASPELQGRDNLTAGGRRAAAYVAEQFRAAGLTPGGVDGWYHDFDKGRNVVGRIDGERKEAVVVAAHHDGHGVIQGKVQPGADDNASGVALVLELARALGGSKPPRTILFVSFDAEEDGLLGSREFVKAGLYPDVAAAFVFDLVGGRFFEWEADRLYAMGSESSAQLSELVRRTKVDGLRVQPLGIYLIEPIPDFARSDYAAFRAKGVPFVFFSTGTPWYYHTEHDTPEVVDFPKLAKVAGYAKAVVAAAAAAPERPAFRKAGPSEEDVAAVREAFQDMMKRAETLTWPEGKREAARALLQDPGPTDAKTLQRAMMLMLTVARAQGKK
jgi:hypothetical protein